jgi:hypothetical protein
MHRLVLLASAIGLCTLAPAEAAPRHKHKVPAAPAVQSAPQPALAKRPIWAAPQQCFSDEGYGRYVPCDVGDGR